MNFYYAQGSQHTFSGTFLRAVEDEGVSLQPAMFTEHVGVWSLMAKSCVFTPPARTAFAGQSQRNKEGGAVTEDQCKDRLKEALGEFLDRLAGIEQDAQTLPDEETEWLRDLRQAWHACQPIYLKQK